MTTTEALIRHYAPQADIDRARWFAYPIVALCGHVWIPTRLGEELPICGECQTAFDQLAPLESAKDREAAK